jgi:hypothetical protein
MQNRRNILGALGLTGAAAVLVSTEAVVAAAGNEINAGSEFPQVDLLGSSDKKSNYGRALAIADALESMARSMREAVHRKENNLPGDQLWPVSLDIKSSMTGDEFLSHEIIVKAEFYGKG